MKEIKVTDLYGHERWLGVQGDITHWRSGRCWAAHCNNEYSVLRVTRGGILSHAYCWWCARDMFLWNFLYQNELWQEWWEIQRNGKIKRVDIKNYKWLAKSYLQSKKKIDAFVDKILSET